jgi:hypothetical protein
VDTILTLLAVTGIAAAVWHVARAGFRFLRHGATGLLTGEVARTHARRGDVTALEEASQARAVADRQRMRSGAEAVGWLILLLVPPLTPWARHVYAAYTLLWLVPALRRRGR